MTVATLVEPESRWVDIEGTAFHYLDWGDPDAPPVILLHGARAHAHTWDPIARALLPEFRTLALDQRGHGDSGGDGLFSRAAGRDPGAMVNDIGRFADSLGLDRFDLAGISMGGLNSMSYAGQHPERVHRLVIVDAGPVLSGDGLQRIARSSVGRKTVFDSPEEAVTQVRASWPAEPPMDEDAEQALRRRTIHNLRRVDDGTWTYKYERGAAADRAVASETMSQADIDKTVQAQHGESEERWRLWRSIEAPTLIARGGVSDILTAEMADRMVAEQPQARLVTIAGSAHSVTVYKARELADEMRSFLLESED